MKTMPKWRVLLCVLAVVVVIALVVVVVLLRNDKQTGVPVTVTQGVSGDLSPYSGLSGRKIFPYSGLSGRKKISNRALGKKNIFLFGALG